MAWSRGATGAIGVLGGRSFVGQSVLARLVNAGAPEQNGSARQVFAFSRATAMARATCVTSGVSWRGLAGGQGMNRTSIPQWIAVCPLWAVPEHFPLMESSGARRLIAVSSTSRLTKQASAAAPERALAARLAAAEAAVIDWARARDIPATILRPTMIYDGLHDRNIAAIASFIRRSGFFPVAGDAKGLRQPVHADDVAAACQAAIATEGLRDTYELSGGETLTYREMVERIFVWLGRHPRLVTIPLPLIRAAAPLVSWLQLVSWLPRAGWLRRLELLPAIAARMNVDLVFDHDAARRDFGFRPRPFALPLGHDPDHAAALT